MSAPESEQLSLSTWAQYVSTYTSVWVPGKLKTERVEKSGSAAIGDLADSRSTRNGARSLFHHRHQLANKLVVRTPIDCNFALDRRSASAANAPPTRSQISEANPRSMVGSGSLDCCCCCCCTTSDQATPATA